MSSGPPAAAAAHTHPVRFIRDNVTWIRYGQLGLFAFLIDGYAPTVALLASDLKLDLPLAALHGTAFGLGLLLAGMASAALSRLIGRSASSWVGVLGICCGVTVYVSSSSSFAFTLAGIGLAGMAGAVTLAAANADLSERHAFLGPRALNEGAAVSQGIGITAPLIIGAFAATAAGWRSGLLVIIALAVALAGAAVLRFRAGGGTQPLASGSVPRDSPSTRLRAQFLSGRFGVAWLSTVIVLGIEFSLMMWSPTFLMGQTGLSTSWAMAAVSVALAGMMLGRFAFAPFTNAHNLDRLLALAVLIFLTGFSVFWLSTSTPLSLAALLITGFGISAQFPISIARLVHLSGGKADVAAASATMALGLAVASAPLLLGLLGGIWGIRTGILLAPALGVTTLLLLVLSPSHGKDRALPPTSAS